MTYETHEFGSESHISKLAERMRRADLYNENTVPTAPICSLQNVVVNNEPDLWITTICLNSRVNRRRQRCRLWTRSQDITFELREDGEHAGRIAGVVRSSAPLRETKPTSNDASSGAWP